MAGIIMDFEGTEVNDLGDAIRIVREIVRENDQARALEFRDAWRAVQPNEADDNLVYVADWAYKDAPDKTRQAMHLLGVTKTVFGGQAPADVLKPVWSSVNATDATVPATLEEAIEAGVLDAAQYGFVAESEPVE